MPTIKQSKVYSITDGDSGTKSFLANSDSELIYLKGATANPALGGDLTITYSGDLVKGMEWDLLYHANVNLNSHNLVIFGEAIDQKLAAVELRIMSFYDGSKFITTVIPNHCNTGFISIGQLDPAIVDNSTIEIDGTIRVKDKGVTMDKITDVTSGYLIVGSAGNRPVAVPLSGDIAITAAGVVTINNTVIGTTKIVDGAVTKDKLTDLTRGSILIGNSSNRPIELAAGGSAKLLIGDGSDLISVTLSGDATISAAGVLTIANNAITTVKILDENVTLAKLEALNSGYLIVGNGSNRPAKVLMSGDATMSATGAVTIGSEKITADKLAPGAITAAKLAKSDLGGGIYSGAIATQVINGSSLKALLDGTTNNLFSVSAGEMILGVLFFVQTGSGSVCTIDVGVDAAARTAGADADGLLKDVDAETPGPYNNWVEANMGALQAFGGFTADNNGNITITASADISGSGFVGGIIIFYLPNNS